MTIRLLKLIVILIGSAGFQTVLANTGRGCLPSTTDTTVSIACGDSIRVGSTAYHTSGIFTDTLTNIHGCDSIITLRLTVNPDTIEQFGGLCAGDSVYFFGTWIYSPGYYDTTLAGIGTCDTFATLTLAVIDPLPPTRVYDTICAGSSISFNGGLIDTSGVYFGHFSNQNGCDSLVVLTLTVHPLPVVTFTWDSLIELHDVSCYDCPNSDSVAQWCPFFFPSYFLLIGGNPPGGHYSDSRARISNDTLTPPYLFLNWDTIFYAYTDTNGCSKTVAGYIDYVLCEGISEINNDNAINIYPNPASTQLYLKAENFKPLELTLYDINGQIIQTGKFEPNIDIGQLSSGVYFMEVKNGVEVARKRFVKM